MTASSIKQIVFDFDSTLFDTEKRKKLFYEMAEVHGYSHTQAHGLYDRAWAEREKIVMSLSSYILALKEQLAKDHIEFLAKEVSKKIKEMNKGSGLLPGAKELVVWCRREERIPCYLLSLGVPQWQAEKVEQSGLGKFFPKKNIIYTEHIRYGKRAALCHLFGKNFDGNGTVLFNDKPDEMRDLLGSFPQLVAFLKIEPRDRRYSPKDYTAVAKDFPGRVVLSESLFELKKKLQAMYAD